MTDETLIADLVRAGVDPDLIGRVANAMLEEARSAHSGGIPVEFPVDSVAEKRRAYDRQRKRNSGGIPVESGGIPPETPICTLSIKKDLKERKKEKRQQGSRIPPEWVPSSEDREFAIAQGVPIGEVDREAGKFRDFWNAKPGVGGVKLDWPATWRNWIRRVCEQRGFAPAPNGAAPSREYRPPPDSGLPTDEELRARHAERGKTAAIATESADLLAEGAGICGEKPNRVGGYHAQHGGMARVGEILPAAGLETVRNPNGRATQVHDIPCADEMAGMVRVAWEQHK